jgi:hypothetical protein
MSVLASAACGFAIREKRVKKTLCQLGMSEPEIRDQVSSIRYQKKKHLIPDF